MILFLSCHVFMLNQLFKVAITVLQQGHDNCYQRQITLNKIVNEGHRLAEERLYIWVEDKTVMT